MPSPTLGEIAYTAYAMVQETPQVLYKALAGSEQLGWGVGVHAALCAVLDPADVPRPHESPRSLLAMIAVLRQQIRTHMTREGLSFQQAGQQCGVDRHTLTRWLAGEENVSVQTLLRLEAWVNSPPQ